MAYEVRYRDPARRERSRTFARRVDAERFVATIETDVTRGQCIDSVFGKVIFDELSTRIERSQKVRGAGLLTRLRGLRWGAAALRRGRFNELKGRVEVMEAVSLLVRPLALVTNVLEGDREDLFQAPAGADGIGARAL